MFFIMLFLSKIPTKMFPQKKMEVPPNVIIEMQIIYYNKIWNIKTNLLLL